MCGKALWIGPLLKWIWSEVVFGSVDASAFDQKGHLAWLMNFLFWMRVWFNRGNDIRRLNTLPNVSATLIWFSVKYSWNYDGDCARIAHGDSPPRMRSAASRTLPIVSFMSRPRNLFARITKERKAHWHWIARQPQSPWLGRNGDEKINQTNTNKKYI